MKLTFVGIDPSLRNWGMVKVEFDTETKRVTPLGSLLVQPEQLNKGRTNTKDLFSAKQLFTATQDFIKDCDAVFAEVPHGSQSSRAMASYGICVGVLGSIQYNLSVPFIQVSANEVKQIIPVDKPQKKDVIDWVLNRHQDFPFPYQTKKGEKNIVMSKAEHLADAMVAIYAGMKTETFKQVIKT